MTRLGSRMRRVVGTVAVGGLAAALLSSGAGAAERVDFQKVDTKSTDVEVFMLVDATDRQVAQVESTIRSSKVVNRYAHLDQEDAMAEFARIFRRNPDLVASIRPSDLPESFRVDLRTKEQAERFARRMQRMPGVESAVRPDPPSLPELLETIRVCRLRQDVDFEVFMRVDATRAELDAARAGIAAEPGLSITDEVSKDEAYEEFRTIFATDRKLLHTVDADDLPASFRVRGVTTPSDELFRRLGGLPGVEATESPRAVCDAIRGMLDDGLSAEQLAEMVQAFA